MRVTLFALLIAGSSAGAQTVAREDGVSAWDRIYAVASHPRCANCHVDARGVPMWEGLGYRAGKAHGMGIKADESRIGAESIPCRTCHVTGAARDVASPAPPQIDDAWRLPPVELSWLGKDSSVLCKQLQGPTLNDGHDIAEMVEHLESSAFVAWGFAPGDGRSVPPGNVAQLASDVARWGAAGSPCE